MPSYKTSVIEEIFRQRFDVTRGILNNPLIMLGEVASAITAHNLATGENRKGAQTNHCLCWLYKIYLPRYLIPSMILRHSSL